MKGFISSPKGTIKFTTFDESTLLATLPAAIYYVGFNNVEGIHLVKTTSQFTFADATLGSATDDLKRILNTYETRNTSTGVLLTGHKGSGKTRFMQELANAMLAKNLPVIIVTQPFSGIEFDMLLSNIGECCILFDEMSKVYSNAEGSGDLDNPSGNLSGQNGLLTLFDGVFDKTKRLIVCSENSEYDINQFLLSRPGRIYYHKRFGKLPEADIKEACELLLNDKTKTDEIVELSRYMLTFSYDILKSIIEEANRYPDQNIESLAKLMNIGYTPLTDDSGFTYEVDQVKFNGVDVTKHVTMRTATTAELDISTEEAKSLGLRRTSWSFHIKDHIIYETPTTVVYKDNMSIASFKKVSTKRFDLQAFLTA